MPEYAGEDGSDIQQFMNVRDEAKSIVQGTDTAMRRPEETSRWFAQTADGILSEVALAEKAADRQSNKELQSTVTDLKILAGLARYHSRRLLAGVSYNLYKQTGDLAAFDEAIANERHALDAWRQMVSAAGDVYSENLAFGAHAVGFSRHWKEEYQLLGRDFEKLLAERQKASTKEGVEHGSLRAAQGEPPSVHLLPAAGANPGRDLEVSATVKAAGSSRFGCDTGTSPNSRITRLRKCPPALGKAFTPRASRPRSSIRSGI